LERRLRDLESKVAGFRLENLASNDQFISATLVAMQAALKTHQKEKLDAFLNAVLNVACARAACEMPEAISPFWWQHSGVQMMSSRSGESWSKQGPKSPVERIKVRPLSAWQVSESARVAVAEGLRPTQRVSA
jgi:hypothetical protein